MGSNLQVAGIKPFNEPSFHLAICRGMSSSGTGRRQDAAGYRLCVKSYGDDESSEDSEKRFDRYVSLLEDPLQSSRLDRLVHWDHHRPAFAAHDEMRSSLAACFKAKPNERRYNLLAAQIARQPAHAKTRRGFSAKWSCTRLGLSVAA